MIVGEKVDFLKNKYLGKNENWSALLKKKTSNSAFYRATSDLQTDVQIKIPTFSFELQYWKYKSVRKNFPLKLFFWAFQRLFRDSTTKTKTKVLSPYSKRLQNSGLNT